MESEARFIHLRKEIESLKEDLQARDKQIQHLEKMDQLKEIHDEMTRKEMLELRETIEAQTSVIDLGARERMEARDTMEVFRNLQELSRDELLFKNAALQQILKINKEITRIPKKETLLNQILDSIMPVLKAERGILFLLNDDRFEPDQTRNIAKQEVQSSEFDIINKIIQESYDEKKTISRMISATTHGEKQDINLICSLLRVKDSILGLIYLDVRSDKYSFSINDIDTVEIFSAQLSIAIENSNLYYNLETEVVNRTRKLRAAYEEINNLYKEIENDLAMAKKMQLSILTGIKAKNNDLEWDVFYLPMSQIGGDIYDFYKINESYFRVFLADATGHGIQAALVTMLIKAEYEKLKRSAERSEDLLYHINNEFYNKYSSLTIIFSMLVVDIDLYNQKIYYASAGHIDQFLLQKNEIINLGSTGKIIGLLENVRYKTIEKPFNTGDKMLLFTDGLTEEVNKNKEMFGDNKMLEIIKGNIDQPAKMILDTVLGEMYKFIDRTGLMDDLTMLSIENKTISIDFAQDRRTQGDRRQEQDR